jgi:hypothetical protein
VRREGQVPETFEVPEGWQEFSGAILGDEGPEET